MGSGKSYGIPNAYRDIDSLVATGAYSFLAYVLHPDTVSFFCKVKRLHTTNDASVFDQRVAVLLKNPSARQIYLT